MRMSKTMRLIDAEALIKDLGYLYTKNHIPFDMRAREVLTTIMEQPTAYDIDKVVRQINLESVSSSIQESLGLLRAIEIVKAGAGNDD